MSWTRVSSSRSNSVVVSPSTPLAPRRFICRQVSMRNAGVSRCANDVKRNVRSAFALAAICSSCVDIRLLLLRVGDVSLAQLLDLLRRFPVYAAFPRAECRVGGGAAHVADLRPPLKLHMQFSRMQLSRKRGAGPRRQRRDQTNQAYQPQLAPEARRREHLPSRTAPPAKAVRPQPSLHPSIELVKESPHVSAFVILAPPANHRIEFADQLRGRERNATLRLPADRVLEPVDRLLRRIRVQTPASRVRLDPRRRQIELTPTPPDRVAEKRDALAHMHNPRLAQIEVHAEGCEDLGRAPQCRFRFLPTPARHGPVIGISRELVASPPHLPIERCQENVAQQGRDHPTLRGALRRGKQTAMLHGASRQHPLDERQHATVRHPLRHQGHELVVVDRPEVVLQIRVHDPLRARFDLSPHLAQRILGRPARSVAKAAVVKERLEDRLKPIEQRLLAHTVDDRRNAQWTPLARFAHLRDVDPSDGQRLVAVGAQVFVQPMQVLLKPLLDCLQALPVDPAAPAVRFDLVPCRTQVLRLVHRVDHRVHLPLSVRLEPVGQFPRRLTEGFFRNGTGPCHRLTPWPSLSHLSLSRTAFPGALLRPLSGRASCLARACGTSPSSDFSPSTGHPFAFWAYRCASAPRSLHAEHPMRSPGVTTCSSAPCRPHTPWSEGWMDNAFIAIVPTRPCPLFGRPVHRRDGSHRFRPGASPQALRIPPRGGHPALLDLYRGQRDVTPAFGYGALHPSTSGTSTHLSMSLPSAHYQRIRLPRQHRPSYGWSIQSAYSSHRPRPSWISQVPWHFLLRPCRALRPRRSLRPPRLFREPTGAFQVFDLVGLRMTDSRGSIASRALRPGRRSSYAQPMSLPPCPQGPTPRA